MQPTLVLPDSIPTDVLPLTARRDVPTMPRCWTCQWLDWMYDTTGDRAYETLTLDHWNAEHVRPLR